MPLSLSLSPSLSLDAGGINHTGTGTVQYPFEAQLAVMQCDKLFLVKGWRREQGLKSKMHN
jgi:molybdate-binding protein